MSDDPFANLNQTGEAAEATDAVTEAFDFFAMEIGEEEFEQPQERQPYVMPEDGSWIPVEIVSAKIGTWAMNIIPPGETEPREVDVPRFELECQHASTAYGDKPWPYNLRVPAFDIKLPGKRGPWVKDSGRRLLAATRVTKPGQRITPEALEELAEAMVGKVVMTQIRHVHKDYTDSQPRTAADGKTFIKAKTNDDGDFMEVVKNETGTFVMKDSGAESPVQDESRYIKYRDAFLIPDVDGTVIRDMVTTTKTFDNLQDNVAPVPAREISYTGLDGKQHKGEITLETVGAVATRPIKANTKVSVLVKGGELIRVSWIGTLWTEAEGDAFDAFKGDAV
jgi:hypothetical protein